MQNASHADITVKEGAEQQAVPSRDTAEIEEPEVQDQEHEHSEECLSHKKDHEHHEIEDIHHIDYVSHGILQEPEPRVESDEPPIEEPGTH